MVKKKTLGNITKKAMLLVPVFFFFSGLTGLMYEILWTRMIVKIIGTSPFAVSIILTIFMGGLGLGSFLASRTIDRIKKPIKLVKMYGILELVIGASGLMIPVLLTAFKPLQAILYNQVFIYFMPYNLLTFISCSILLFIPVICMGATLPILCRFYVTKLSHLGTSAGRLYGLNTVGAALGALLCGFWLINLLGVWGSLIFAVLINGIIGFSCLLLDFKAKALEGDRNQIIEDSKKIPSEETSHKTILLESPTAVNGALVIFFVSGLCSMAYEVIWIKLLGLIVGPTTYSFTIVLVTFITGLALGSIIFGWLADKTKNPVWLLICTQIGAGLFILGVSQLLGNSQLFFAKLIFYFQNNFALLTTLKAVTLFTFMIIPTICLGAAFPLVGKIYTQSVSKVGRSIGIAYSINAIGAVLGSFCAGFLLIPLVGKENGLSFVVGMQLLTSLVIAGVVFGRKMKGTLKLTTLTVLALIGLFLCIQFPKWNHDLLSSGKYHRFEYIETEIKGSGWLESLLRGSEILKRYDLGESVYYGEGIGGFTTVFKTPDPLGSIEYSMANSGKMDASSRRDMKTQTLLAHFPMLFHKAPKTVMVLGLASGITAGEVLNYPIEQLDVLEISRQVVRASDFFLPWNNKVLSNPKTALIIQDARAHLQLTKQKYDVIISEPSNPWMAGLAALFTRDFFGLVEKRLNDDGIFVQWFHSYDMDWSTFSLVGRTFARVFPNSILVSTNLFPHGRDYLLVGFKGKSGLILENAEQNFPYVQQSKNVTLTDPRLLYRLIVSEDIQRLFGQGPIHTDSRPRLEFAAPKLMYQRGSEIIKNIQFKKWLSPETKNIIKEVLTDMDAQIGFAIYALSLYMPFPDMVDLSQATPLQKERFFKLMETYCAKNSIDYAILKDDELAQRCRSIQIETIQNKIDLMPDKAGSYFYLANLFYMKDMLNEAIANYSKSLEIKYNNAYTHNNLGYALTVQGNFDEAVTHFTEALRIKPDFAEAQRNLGYSLARQGKLEEATKEYLKAIQMLPDNHTLHNDLGVILARQGKSDEAIKHFTEALRIKPDFAEAQRNLKIIQRQR